jgi:hypothetical protein
VFHGARQRGLCRVVLEKRVEKAIDRRLEARAIADGVLRVCSPGRRANGQDSAQSGYI